MGNSATPWRGAWALMVFLQLFCVISLLVPTTTMIAYCCWAEGRLKDPTPGKAQMLCPHKPHVALVKGAEHPWNAQAHCLHVGRTAPGPICFTLVGAKGWLLGIFPFLHLCPHHPLGYRPGFGSWATGESETFYFGVLKVVFLWGNLNWGSDRNWSFQIIEKYNWKIELRMWERINWTALFDHWRNGSLRFLRNCPHRPSRKLWRWH